MKRRMIIVTRESILALFKDYLGPEYIPEDAKVTGIMINPETRKFALVVESPRWTTGDPIEVRFDIRRIYGVN